MIYAKENNNNENHDNNDNNVVEQEETEQLATHYINITDAIPQFYQQVSQDQTITIKYSGYQEFHNETAQDRDNKVKYKLYDVYLGQFQYHQSQYILIRIEDQLQSQIDNLIDINIKKEENLNVITHDLKQPAEIISTTLNKCLNCINNKKRDITRTQDFLGKKLRLAKSCTEMLFALIFDIQDYGKILRGQLKLTVKEFCIDKLFQEIYQMYKIIIEQGNEVVLKLKMGQCIKDNQNICISDEIRLKQILFNLLNNAKKFTKSGFIRLKIELFDEKYYKISVKDTGSGIGKEDEKQIFKKYFTTGNNLVANRAGVGIGLWMCQQLVHELGPSNKIYLKSKDNIGSEFSFFIYQNLQEKNNSNNNNNFSFSYQEQNAYTLESDIDVNIDEFNEENSKYSDNESFQDTRLREFSQKYSLKQSIRQSLKQSCLGVSICGPIPQKKHRNETRSSTKKSLPMPSPYKKNRFSEDQNLDHNKDSNDWSIDQVRSQEIQHPSLDNKKLNSEQSEIFPFPLCDTSIDIIKENIKKIQQPINILGVDDERQNVQQMKESCYDFQILKLNKFQDASSADECINIFKELNQTEDSEKNIHFILIDYQMPFTNGIQACEELQKLIKNENYVKPYIILTTCYDKEQIENSEVVDEIITKRACYETKDLEKILISFWH